MADLASELRAFLIVLDLIRSKTLTKRAIAIIMTKESAQSMTFYEQF